MNSGSPSHKSETLQQLEQQYSSQISSTNKKLTKGKLSPIMTKLKAIENEILKGSKEAISYTFHYDDNNSISSIHFTKAFIERAGWEVQQFQMFCLYNGLPELISYENYYFNLTQTLLNQLYQQNSTQDQILHSVYLHKIGMKIETQTKKSSVPCGNGTNMTYQIINIFGDNQSQSKSILAPPQKVRGRKHFQISEQNTLECNLECPLNEMDNHQHRVCKYRIINNQFLQKKLISNQ